MKALSIAGVTIDPTTWLCTLAKSGAAIGLATLSWHLFEKRILGLKEGFSYALPSVSR